MRAGERLRALAAGVIEDLFAEAECLGGDLEVLVFGKIFQAALQAVFNRRAEGDAFAVALRTHVGKIFGFAGVDHHVGGAGVLAHNHACIDIFLRSDEESAAFLQIIEGVGHGGSRFKGDEYTVDPGRNFATERTVLTEEMGNDPHAFG